MDHRISFFGFVLLLALPTGCGDSDSSDTKNTGGKAGTGGSGATGGKGGSGGTGATSSGGSGGSVGGAGGSGGSTGGSAGTSTGGASGGSAGASGGAAGAGGSAGGSGKACGGKGGSQCDAGEYCDWSDDSCGVADQLGQCKVATNCGVACSPVCGCDGEAYCNVCIAGLHGVDTVPGKACVPGNGGDGIACFVDGDCQTGFKCCRECGALGCPQSCTKVATGGSCPALP